MMLNESAGDAGKLPVASVPTPNDAVHPCCRIHNLVQIGARLCQWHKDQDPRYEGLRVALERTLGQPVAVVAMPFPGGPA